MQIAREYLGELEKRREWREAVSIAFVLEDTLKEMKLREKAGEVTVEEREMREERERYCRWRSGERQWRGVR